DVGCGTGGTMARLARYHLEKIDGVDVTPSMLRVARNRIRLVGLGRRSALHLVEPGGRLPFTDESYDRAYTESVLGFQNAEGAEVLLREIFRVLTPGGRYVANEAIWRVGVPPETIAAINATCLADFGLRMASDSPWVLDDWLSIMRVCGFQVVSANLVGDQPTGRSARRSGLDLRTLACAALTRSYWLRSYLTPAGLRARAGYRRLNRQHRNDGRHIEPRLFVLEKPLHSGLLSGEFSA
ncbi:MAG: class I SAM-dependent methyltransferase, partial [Chloroflexota bacterium]